jgi:hypothetical protein
MRKLDFGSARSDRGSQGSQKNISENMCMATLATLTTFYKSSHTFTGDRSGVVLEKLEHLFLREVVRQPSLRVKTVRHCVRVLDWVMGWSVLDGSEIRDWDRQRDEPYAAWSAFRRYRDGTRVMSEVAEAVGAAPGTISRWAEDWSWKHRVVEWDRHVDKKAQETILNSDTARQVHLATASRLRELGLRALERLLDELQVDGRAVTASAVVRALEAAVKIERLTLGQPTEIHASETDYSRLTDEEFDLLVRLQAKADES